MKRMTNTLIIAIMAMTSLALPLHRAQADSDWHEMRGGKGYFMIGWSGLDLDGLNRALVAEGYSPFSEDYLSLGGGGHAWIGRLVIGGQGHAYVTDKQDVVLPSGNHRSSLSAGIGFFDMGVVAWSRDGFALTPLVGLGGGSLTLEVQELSAPTFGEVLAEPGRQSKLTMSGFLVDLGVSADWLIGRHDGDERKGAAVGVRAGWVLSPFDGDWKLFGRDIAGGPSFGVAGPYVRFMVGAGGVGIDD